MYDDAEDENHDGCDDDDHACDACYAGRAPRAACAACEARSAGLCDRCDRYEGGFTAFYDEGGDSALRAGQRVYPCPTCGTANSLTAADRRRRYQCDDCADRAERGGY